MLGNQSLSLPHPLPWSSPAAAAISPLVSTKLCTRRCLVSQTHRSLVGKFIYNGPRNATESFTHPFVGRTPAEIDLIGTMSISLMTLFAPLVVQFAKKFSPRRVSLLGTVIFCLSLELASFGKELWHFELTQGLLLGLGTCMCYMVAATVAPAWYTTHRGLAMGIVLSGTGLAQE
jgi:MFS family permease